MLLSSTNDDSSVWLGFSIMVLFLSWRLGLFSWIAYQFSNEKIEFEKQVEDDKKSKEYIYHCLKVLTKSYGIKEHVTDQGLKIQFDHQLYAECVLEIMRKMGLNNTVKVTCYSDEKFPRKQAAAFVNLPTNNMPPLNSIAFQNLRIPICIKKSITNKYETFVYVVAHELSHIVLHGTNHSLKESEVATDLFVLISGFGWIMEEGIRVWKSDNYYKNYGYLKYHEFVYAKEYLAKIKSNTFES